MGDSSVLRLPLASKEKDMKIRVFKVGETWYVKVRDGSRTYGTYIFPCWEKAFRFARAWAVQ